jgi:hypothetical protein
MEVVVEATDLAVACHRCSGVCAGLAATRLCAVKRTREQGWVGAGRSVLSGAAAIAEFARAGAV